MFKVYSFFKIFSFKQYLHNLTILRGLDTNGLKAINDLMEKVYPGFQGFISDSINNHPFSVFPKAFDFIKKNGGTQKLADYYNNADKDEKQYFIDTIKKTFKKDFEYEEQILLLTKLSKLKGYDNLAHTLCDVKDNIVMSSIQSGQRTIDQWKTFVRREQERGNDFKLGILDQIEFQEAKDQNNSDKSKENETKKQEKTNKSKEKDITFFPEELLEQLYDYNGVVFKTITSIDEFKKIIIRAPHKEKLVPCDGKTLLLYFILRQLSKIPPKEKRDDWYDDILKECGLDKDKVRKKAGDALNSNNNNTRNTAKQLKNIFDEYLKYI